MTSINENARWEDSIPMIQRGDKVEGGRDAKPNIQAGFLANRTQYLRDEIEKYSGMLKVGEQPYSTEEEAQQAIDAGKILPDALFSVRSNKAKSWVDEYKNINGAAIPTGKTLPSLEAVNALQELLSEQSAELMLFVFSDMDDFHVADISFDEGTGKPGFNLGRMSLKRSNESAFEVTDPDGFSMSVDNLINRLRALESGEFVYNGMSIARSAQNVLEITDADGFVISLDDVLVRLLKVEKGTFAYNGQSLQRSPDKLFEIRDEDGFTFTIDDLIQRIVELEKGNDNGSSGTHSGEIVAYMENIAQAARAAMAHPVSAPIAVIRNGLNIYIFYGQSLAIGDEAFSVVSRDVSMLGNLMLGQAVRGQYYGRTSDASFGVIGGQNRYYPLQEKRQDGAVIVTDPTATTKMGETVATGFMETLKTLHNRAKGVRNDDEVTLACSVTGAVGTGLSTLLKGASTPYYERLLSCVRGHMEAAAAAGYSDVQVAGMIFLQGENDYGSATTRENYLQMLNSLFNDFNTDAKEITGQADNVGFFLYQSGGTYVTQSQNNTLPVGMAQLDITGRNDAFMVAPVFPYPQAVAAKTHKSANAYRWWGCAAANTVHRIYHDENHIPFRMEKAVYDGKDIYISFMVPCPPLTVQPFYQVATPVIKPDWGFTVIDSTGSLAGASLAVEFVSPCVVRITPSRPLSGSVRINIGDQIHGGGHNIADSSPQQSIFSWQYYGDENQPANENIPELNNKPYPLFNFAAIQTINVEEVK